MWVLDSKMGLLKMERGYFRFFFLCLMIRLAAGNVVLIGKNVSLSFNDIEANFAPEIKESGEYGVLYTAEPLDACDTLKNKVVEGLHSPFVLIIRGGCIFDDKVRAAQRAGFKAAIVYNNEDNNALVSMAGTSEGITIHAVFVTKSSGEVLKKYAERMDVELWIMPTFENSAWSIIAISLISLLAMSTVMATCFFVRRYRIRREVPRVTNVREFHGMSRRLVKSMPSLIFTSVLEDNCTSRMCAVCLEDYNIGEKIRVLPCRHKFHALCVDAWLTTWRTFCPVCKRDANTSTGAPPASESTPLLSSTHALSTSPSSAAGALSSFHSTPLLSSTQELSTSPSSVAGAFSSFYSTPLLSSTHALSTSPSTLGKSSSFHSYLAASPSRAILVSPMLTHSSLTSHSAAAGALSSFRPSAVASSSRAIFISPMLPRSPLNSRTPSYLARLLAQVSAESLPGC